jgi:hypothetical protein
MVTGKPRSLTLRNVGQRPTLERLTAFCVRLQISLGQSELFRDGGSGSFGLEFKRLSTDVSIVAV